MNRLKPSQRLRGYGRRLALLVVILWLLVEIRLRLWMHPYRNVRAWADVQATRPRGRFRDVDHTWVTRWIGRLGRLVPKGTCLVRALTLQILMGRRGIPVEIVFGAKFGTTKKFEAHAWVEYRGRILIGDGPDVREMRVLRREVVPGVGASHSVKVANSA
jgi:hypothetical protein